MRGLLEDYLRLEQFEKSVEVPKEFIDKTMIVMTDDSHMNPANLNLKVQNHKKLEEERFSQHQHSSSLEVSDSRFSFVKKNKFKKFRIVSASNWRTLSKCGETF